MMSSKNLGDLTLYEIHMRVSRILLEAFYWID